MCFTEFAVNVVQVGVSWTEYHRVAHAHGAALGPYAAQGAVLRWAHFIFDSISALIFKVSVLFL